MEYNFTDIEQSAREKWQKMHIYKVNNQSNKPKFYVLDMFPYPSGAGLHVGHPLGYIASDIYARYKRLKGFNVLHPMGFDAFGLPAEQYALETGQHPADTTEKNINRYKEQLNNIGFCFDWEREVRTSDPKYYKWTQWIFLELFNSWYDYKLNKARPIKELIEIFEKEGSANLTNKGVWGEFSNSVWNNYEEVTKREILMSYRLAYLAYSDVWWCETLGTVLANDEVVNGVSERGGHPVEKKQMRQWFLRITAFAERLLESLEKLDWSESMKEMQRNWIGKSVGAEIIFKVNNVSHDMHGVPIRPKEITVFTTRPNTIFGVDFMVLAPEHSFVEVITTTEQKEEVEKYIKYVKSRSERERISEVKQITGCFTGAYAVHPFTEKLIPIWISEYVRAGYGTGAIMAVPSGDERDHAYAKHFGIPITNIFGDRYTGEKAYSEKTGIIENSDFLSGLSISEATEYALAEIEKAGIGTRKVNYILRDAGFSRQRYWGEPFPIVYNNDIPYSINEIELLPNNFKKLPVELPNVKHYTPGPDGQGPLANITDWMNISTEAIKRETNTMPGYAGSSWYFLRYMDPQNENEFASRTATDYWNQVDLYVGGTEHAVGHLLYARMWTKALHDLGYIGFDEPFKKLLNQGMIQGQSYFYSTQPETTFQNRVQIDMIRRPKSWTNTEFRRAIDAPNTGVHKGIEQEVRLKHGHLYVDTKNRLTKSKFIEQLKFVGIDDENINSIIANTIWEQENTENGEQYIQCKIEVEKMSKSKYNVVNPDDIVKEYGADTFRMYEMFLGPVEMSKPWDTKGIEGVHRFLKKFWRLYNNEKTGFIVTDDSATDAEMRILHKTIKKVSDDIERFSFNTTVSQFMITVNELTDINCHKRTILEPLCVLISAFAPHIAEELWKQLGKDGCVVAADFPKFEEKYLKESTKLYPIAVNGKPRTEIEFTLDAKQEYVEKTILADATVQKWLEGKTPKKIIYVQGKMINIVV